MGEAVHRGAGVGGAGPQEGGGEVGPVGRIREVLRLQAQAIALPDRRILLSNGFRV